MTQLTDFNTNKSANYKRLAEELISQKGWPRYYTMGYYSEDFGCEVFDFNIPLTEEQYNHIKSVVEECKEQDIPVSEYFDDHESPEYVRLNLPGFCYDPSEINMDKVYYPCNIKMAVFYNGIDNAPQVIERKISLSYDEYLELLIWQLNNRNASYNDLYDCNQKLFKIVDDKVRMLFSGNDICVMPPVVPMYAVELTSIKEDAFQLCGEGELQREIFYNHNNEFSEHSFLDIMDRKMSFSFGRYDYSKEMTTEVLILEDIDALAVEKALGVDNYAGIVDSLSLYFGARDGVACFAEFLRSKSIDFIEKDQY